MLKRICRCKKIIPYEVKLCEECQAKEDIRVADRHKRYKYNQTDKEEERFYAATRWKNCRDFIRARDNGLCKLCYDEGKIRYMDVVHHIVELKEDKDKAYVPTNLISLCNKCHGRVHAIYKTTDKLKIQDRLERLAGRFKREGV